MAPFKEPSNEELARLMTSPTRNNMPNMNAQAQLLRLARHNKSVEDALALIGKSAIHKDDHKDEEKERSPFGRAA